MAHWNRSLLLGSTILWTMLIPYSGFPTGAPISACEDMLPVHPGAQPQPTGAPYEFLISSSSFLNGQPINIQILGPAYRGLLLEARSFGSNNALGFWKTPPNNTKFLQCSGNPYGAVTHANTNLKTRQTTYTWLPPDSGCPKVVMFMATVAQSYDIYWTNVKSKVIWKNPKATCGAEMLTRTQPATALLLPLLLILSVYL